MTGLPELVDTLLFRTSSKRNSHLIWVLAGTCRMYIHKTIGMHLLAWFRFAHAHIQGRLFWILIQLSPKYRSH